MSFNLKSLAVAKKAITIVVVLIILYPIVVWIYIGNCKAKYGIVDNKVIAEYQDQNNPNFKQKIIYGPTWNDITMICD